MTDDATNLNTLADYLGQRDVPDPAGVGADVLVLFGGSPPEGWDLAARAFRAGAADRMLLVGGAGHTTPMLRAALRRRHPDLAAPDAPEADLMADYLAVQHGITGCLLERESTNCGNNITFAERTLRDAGLTPRRMIFMQDASMQRRMHAAARRVWTLGTPEIINFAATRPRFEIHDNTLRYAGAPHWGTWELAHGIRLLLGEVPRLDPHGYGPQGADFIVHVDIPPEVVRAHDELSRTYGIRSWG